MHRLPGLMLLVAFGATSLVQGAAPCPLPSSPHARGLAPMTPRYVVVPPAGSTPMPGHAPSGQACWPIETRTAAAYPWGWFGAQSKALSSRRGSYYGDTRDYLWLGGR